MAKKTALKKVDVAPSVRLDLGAGKNGVEGFVKVDLIRFPGVDVVCDLANDKWPWSDGEVSEVHCSHMLEHISGERRVWFFNELHRVMRKDAKASIVVPHWSSGRAYGDVTHQWPPVVEMFWYYLDKPWRDANAPHVGFECDFLATWGYSVAPNWQARNQETQMFGINHYREVAQDMIATIIKR